MTANEGCFYWGWFIACEMQLFLITPLLVYLCEFKLPQSIVPAFLGVFTGGALAITYFILYSNSMSAGLFAPQDIFIFELWLTKAYTKLHCLSIGIFMARTYQNINS
jgi:peptidoglycan/LPS O-acetylase OafA/YrhL